jgi:hypothetical protein
MSITVSLGAAIFLSGAAIGALLTRLQWIAFKQKVSQEMMAQFAAAPSVENGPTKFDHPGVESSIARCLGDSHPLLAASPFGERTSSDIVAEPALKRLLEQNQMEIARILREVQALWCAIGLSQNDPDVTEQSLGLDCSNDRRSLQFKYAQWFKPSRALKPH